MNHSMCTWRQHCPSLTALQQAQEAKQMPGMCYLQHHNCFSCRWLMPELRTWTAGDCDSYSLMQAINHREHMLSQSCQAISSTSRTDWLIMLMLWAILQRPVLCCWKACSGTTSVWVRMPKQRTTSTICVTPTLPWPATDWPTSSGTVPSAAHQVGGLVGRPGDCLQPPV